MSADKTLGESIAEIERDYVPEARRILSKALHERVPATAEAIGELELDPFEHMAVNGLAVLLFMRDNI